MQEALQVHEEMRNFKFGDPPARSGLWILSHFVATWVWRHQYGQMALTLGYVSSICTDHQPMLGCNWWILNWSTFITIRFCRFIYLHIIQECCCYFALCMGTLYLVQKNYIHSYLYKFFHQYTVRPHCTLSLFPWKT